MIRKPTGMIAVNFISSDNKLSKPYYFYIDEKVKDVVLSTKILTNKNQIYHIKNEKGYNYRDAFVLITLLTSTVTIEKRLEYLGLKKEEILFIDEIIETDMVFLSSTHKIIQANIDDNLTDINILPTVKNKGDRKREKNMNNYAKNNLVIGKVEDLEMSIYGPAFGTYDGFISYDKKNDEWVDVSQILFVHSRIYAIPVSRDQIKVNDFIYYNGNWIRVLEIKDGNIIRAEIPRAKEIINIMPVKNMFGLDFYSKLVYIDFNTINIDNDNNMLMYMMMGDDDMKMKDMMMLMMINKNTNCSMDFNNPMMMYMIMKNEDEDIDPMMMMLMMNQSQK